jgi:hypothetical protein
MLTRKKVGFLLGLLAVACIPTSPSVLAQDLKPSQYRCHYYSSDPNDPISAGLRQIFECYSGGFIALAEEIPVGKYTTQRILAESVGYNVGHVATISESACSKMLRVAIPKPPRKVEGDADKDGMVAWLKSTMGLCKRAFSELSDSKLSEAIPWNYSSDVVGDGWHGPRVTRFGAASFVTSVLIERYGAIAGYFQLHGSLSPFAAVPLVRTGEK